MLERFDNLDNRNKNSPKLLELKNNSNIAEKTNINGNGSDQDIEFLVDKKLKPEEFCKGCFLF